MTTASIVNLPDEALKYIKNNDYVTEGYVLIRELKVYLNVGHEHYYPCLKIKVWLGSLSNREPFYFTLSHYARTPIQASPYCPSITHFTSEEVAIQQAIAGQARYLVSAIDSGEEPNDNWLVPNEDF